ncbi:MAG: signal peptidase II [Synergistaceae bacterium]|jgi:signal peptidase II|nr:signal peptidase II [Synergistaceae bacterium]
MKPRYSDIFIFILALTADRLTKSRALSGSLGSLYLNHGISFSLLERHASVSLFFTLAGLGILGYACVKSATVRRAPGIIWLFSGAAGNLIDRLVYGYVIDWIHIGIFFNLADLWLCIGGVRLLGYSLSAPSEK